jgi:hypothetical protein
VFIYLVAPSVTGNFYGRVMVLIMVSAPVSEQYDLFINMRLDKKHSLQD